MPALACTCIRVYPKDHSNRNRSAFATNRVAALSTFFFPPYEAWAPASTFFREQQ
jgi:hypothetical protein